MSARLDELRPTRGDSSLMRTFIGSFLREIGGWVAVADLVNLFEGLGVSGASVRTNLSRLKAKGLLVPQARGATGYALADEAEVMLARGDRRIYGYHQMRVGDPWMVVVFSVPEAHRHLRHQLRTRLTWLGCGAMTPGAWIGPGHLIEETREVLAEVDLLRYTTILCTQEPLVDGDLADAVARWWDLPALGGRYDVFTSEFEPVAARWRAAGDEDRATGRGQPAIADWQSAAGNEEVDGPAAFSDYLRALDAWRSIPYLDPALPPEYLPHDWPGQRGVALFAELHERLSGPSLSHVLAVTGRHAAAG
ncbi:PaaX family transcriptional regulator C-terminal domain-containing protein [Segeticoccus rhizosphaerae]|uniref:PaaX family transcriptional regulator n=1 Tax=Segeticoccus rhizosphaerae TaxID=1104777 RepID=UPI0012647A5F|nr:PaaX family transcriptional regulator C-terminal domain-containing protein [Segeticoccus rhizosphaerae]